MRYRYFSRLIALVCIAIIYMFINYPIPAIVTSVVLLLGYILFTRLSAKKIEDNGQEYRRREALNAAKIYLSPYKDIWRNLKLSNKFCTLKLGTDGMTIIAKEKGKDLLSYRTFRIVSSKVHSMLDLWDMFCLSFSHNTTYDGLVDDCRLYQTIIKEDVIETPCARTWKQRKENITEKPICKKTDINNASEIELTELPGISIVMAKKIIKKREEIGGFKNINDLFLYLKLKPHIQNQLNSLVCANKMKGFLNIERSQERSVDL